MNEKETRKRLEESAELVSTHLGDSDQEWEIHHRNHANKPNTLVLIFKVEYEED